MGNRIGPSNSKLLKAPTREEKDERRRKGLCMWFGVKFVACHCCVRSQLYQLLVDVEKDVLHDADQRIIVGENLDVVGHIDAEEGLKLVISLHALLGTGDSQTMRL